MGVPLFARLSVKRKGFIRYPWADTNGQAYRHCGCHADYFLAAHPLCGAVVKAF
jgi:hypothetical protein